MKTFIAKILTALTLAVIALPASAVTKQEFERARFLAAKAYVRYSNDGAGYLDTSSPSSLSELTNAVSPHETDKKNLQDFMSKSTPSDYASWDKKKLQDYWSKEFFAQHGLQNKAQSAMRSKIQAGIGAMTVSEPTDKAEEPEETPATDSAKKQEDTASTETPVPSEFSEELTTVSEETNERLYVPDSAAVDSAGPQQDTITHPSSVTWVYIVVLILLILVVVALVWYAARLLKQQKAAIDAGNPKKAKKATKNSKGSKAANMLKKVKAAKPMPEEIEPEEEEEEEIVDEEEYDDPEEVEETEEPAPVRKPTVTPAPTPRPQTKPAARKAPEEVTQPAAKSRVIYLGRTNKDKVFVRADLKYVPGKSVFMLKTENGNTGSFSVVDDPEIMQALKTDLRKGLETACVFTSDLPAGGVHSIVTDAPGVAIFEGGCWRVSRPSAIHFI